MKDMISKTKLLLTLSLYSIIGFLFMMYDELLPLLCATDYIYGGLNLSSMQIGMCVDLLLFNIQ